jgi:SAM-dependent methyltransferase
MRQHLWRACYELLASRVPSPDWAFMNYGFAPVTSAPGTPVEPALVLEAHDEPDRLCIQLYDHCITGVDLAGVDVLEVGCGRGGGASYLSRSRRPRRTVGVDFSRRAVELCRRHRSGPDLSFRQGDALDLPFASSSFDVVVNVESSHCYSSMPRFLDEVRRVLRPGGSFCWADLRNLDALETLQAQFANSGLTLVRQDDITANVLAALRIDNERKTRLIDDLIARPLHRPFRAFAGIQGTLNFDKFEDGSLRYLSARLRKEAD